MQALFRWATMVCECAGSENLFHQCDAAAGRRVERFFCKAHARSLAERPADVRRSSSVAAWEASWRRLCHAYSLMHDRDAVLALMGAEDELLLQSMENREALNLWISCGLAVRAEDWPFRNPCRALAVAQKRLLGVLAREWGELEVQRVAQAVAALDGSGE